tara:strand:+ start:1752 stop:2036 length:285 start_codon:yes stop_codon:yes gene_type:complete
MALPLIGTVGRLIMRNKNARKALAGMAGAGLGYLGLKKSTAKPKTKGVKRSMRMKTAGTHEKEVDSHKAFNKRMRETHKKYGIKPKKLGRASLR